jgi:hypothetical protein
VSVEAIMAYLDLTANHPFAIEPSNVAAEARLSGRERMVVVLSRTDPLWSLRPRHTHSRALRFLFGIEAPHQLADQRLEALRRYAVTYRLRDVGVSEAEAGAVAAGFSARQLGQARHMVDGARANHSRKSANRLIGPGLLALAVSLIIYGATAWLSPRFDSTLIAFVLVAVAMLGFASFAGGEPVRGSRSQG